MDIDPTNTVADATAEHEARSRLNTLVAITVALLATFIGVCKVKDDNLVQAMQQAQADRIDHWSYYQAKNVREEVARAAADQMRALAIAMPAGAAAFRTAVARYDSVADIEATKKQAVRAQAEQDQKHPQRPGPAAVGAEGGEAPACRVGEGHAGDPRHGIRCGTASRFPAHAVADGALLRVAVPHPMARSSPAMTGRGRFLHLFRLILTLMRLDRAIESGSASPCNEESAVDPPPCLGRRARAASDGPGRLGRDAEEAGPWPSMSASSRFNAGPRNRYGGRRRCTSDRRRSASPGRAT